MFYVFLKFLTREEQLLTKGMFILIKPVIASVTVEDRVG
jgi:hypothetical protein